MTFMPNKEWEKELHDKDMEALDMEVRIRSTDYKRHLAIRQTEEFVGLILV